MRNKKVSFNGLAEEMLIAINGHFGKLLKTFHRPALII